MAEAKVTVSVDGRAVYKIEQEAALAERERIIALLEAEMCRAYGEDCSNNPSCSARDAIVTLIRGAEK